MHRYAVRHADKWSQVRLLVGYREVLLEPRCQLIARSAHDALTKPARTAALLLTVTAITGASFAYEQAQQPDISYTLCHGELKGGCEWYSYDIRSV